MTEVRLKATLMIAAVLGVGLMLLTAEGGCVESCHDELFVDISANLAPSHGSCLISLVNGKNQVVYQCPATTGDSSSETKSACSPVDGAPTIADCTCSNYSFVLTTQSNAEGAALQAELGGNAFSIEATCDGSTDYATDGGRIQTQKCD